MHNLIVAIHWHWRDEGNQKLPLRVKEDVILDIRLQEKELGMVSVQFSSLSNLTKKLVGGKKW